MEAVFGPLDSGGKRMMVHFSPDSPTMWPMVTKALYAVPGGDARRGEVGYGRDGEVAVDDRALPFGAERLGDLREVDASLSEETSIRSRCGMRHFKGEPTPLGR